MMICLHGSQPQKFTQHIRLFFFKELEDKCSVLISPLQAYNSVRLHLSYLISHSRIGKRIQVYYHILRILIYHMVNKISADVRHRLLTIILY